MSAAFGPDGVRIDGAGHSNRPHHTAAFRGNH